jgi:penicillin-binding protein 1A
MATRPTPMRLLAMFLVGYVPVFGAALLWQDVNRDLPEPQELESWTPPLPTVLTDRNGAPMGELYEDRRYLLAPDGIPPLVASAFIAAEDASFHDHYGVDLMGIGRAVITNLREGRRAQGASTITQQVVRMLLLRDNEKSWRRKAREATLAIEVERVFGKDEILAFYLNSVYLGARSYGVEAAARTYFGKPAGDLQLAEAALLAGLPQRPSDYNPIENPDAALARRRYVLDQMVATGRIDADEARTAAETPLLLAEARNPLREVAPHFSEHVRRLLEDKLGAEVLDQGGLLVRTTCDLELQAAADEALRSEVVKAAAGTAWSRDPSRQLADEAAIAQWRDRQEQALGGADDGLSTLPVGTVSEAVVLEVAHERLKVAIGSHVLLVLLEDNRWVMPNRWTTSLLTHVDTDGDGRSEGTLFEVGDRIDVVVAPDRTAKDRRGRPFPVATLHRVTDLQGALLSMELPSGAVRAMVGGTDFDDSQFNRATQARRQVGSTFKPIVYAAGLDAGKLNPATVIDDSQLSVPLGGGKTWSPTNFGDDYAGPITATKALAESRNTALVRVLERIDPGMNRDVVYQFATRLGLGGARGAEPASPTNDYLCPWLPETPTSKVCMDHTPARDDLDLTDMEHRDALGDGDEHLCRACDYSVGLGSTSLTLEEMTQAYTVFAAEGQLVEPLYIEEVRDRSGNVVWAPPPQTGATVIDPAIAGVMRTMLEAVVERGTATKVRATGLAAAGKTGTSNDGKDAWFIGFTPTVITGVWVGYDAPRSIGPRATGGRVAVPIWTTYMASASPERTKFPEVPGTVMVSIDEWTGGRVLDGGWGRNYRFVPGTVPRGVSTEPYVRPPDPSDAPVEPELTATDLL